MDVATEDNDCIRPVIASTRSLQQLHVRVPAAPPQLAELLEAIPPAKPGTEGPLAKLEYVDSIKFYGLEPTDIRDGIRQLQKCLVDRGCSKSLVDLVLVVSDSDCHSLLLNDYDTFKAVATFVERICGPLRRCLHFPSTVLVGNISSVDGFSSADGSGDIEFPLNHLLAYTQFPEVSGFGPQLLSALLEYCNVRMGPRVEDPECPLVETGR
ncbi:unnamed protein product [Vitrella brassicaformis CCMP3155]|uniref:Uncharacterized protein n=1 Tax=Vitrella brassicaformis (strain CCMP3155) TaxID=1169540 RepID=A0A0G4EVP0_VITBC|nr:unnamed protein product [Vitrella brassicaformis CCMP3155]|eukprot:CEM02364.1 unnamed protein product [Vitrella brassicaformis CCMP3155]